MKFLKNLPLLLLLAGAFVFTACSEDDDDDTTPPTAEELLGQALVPGTSATFQISGATIGGTSTTDLDGISVTLTSGSGDGTTGTYSVSNTASVPTKPNYQSDDSGTYSVSLSGSAGVITFSGNGTSVVTIPAGTSSIGTDAGDSFSGEWSDPGKAGAVTVATFVRQ